MSLSFLFVMDPIERCHQQWDNTLTLGREFLRRGHAVWMADASDLGSSGKNFWAKSRKLLKKSGPLRRKQNDLTAGPPQMKRLPDFDLVWIRKDPPFNTHYLQMTYLLELIADKIPVVNHPRGLRNANEKLSIFNFPRRIPESFVSSSPEQILAFQKRLETDLVVKPLADKGGNGIFILRHQSLQAGKLLRDATQGGKKILLAQKLIQNPGKNLEKRLFIVNGKILAAVEKRPVKNDFRANLSLGGQYFPTEVSRQDQLLAAELKPYLLREGLLIAGIDVLNNKLIEINVTSPAGIFEAQDLYPERRPLAVLADFLEGLI